MAAGRSSRVGPALKAAEIESIVAATHREPRSVLGYHEFARRDDEPRCVVRVLEPDADEVAVYWEDEPAAAARPLRRLHPGGLYAGHVPYRRPLVPYRLRIRYRDGTELVKHDPYYFAPQLSDYDLHLFGEGAHHRIWAKLGAHRTVLEGLAGTRFAVWAPNAARVSVVGPFNLWDGRKHAMHARGGSGVWELFIPGLDAGAPYKYEIRTAAGATRLKADPYGFAMELRPGNCSLVAELGGFEWHDAAWLAARGRADPRRRPLNVYEVHLGSWRRVAGREPPFMNWHEAAEQLIPYALDLGYTHLELMGVAEHPFDGSWGYQVAGYYAPTARFGTPHDFMRFVDRCHAAGLGVLMDWVPGHFPKDDHGLVEFDGTALYEHADPRQGEHMDWGTKIFNFGRNEVRNFLVANALYWLSEFHIDGLRVDAVASMLYLDYSRQPGEWVPNRYGGRENLEAIDFLRHLNWAVQEYAPGALMIAEESTAFPGVTQPTHLGGLGFTFKWNMGWMNDTLRYLALDPVYRSHEHRLVTFSFMYAWSERFVLPISHDEVVHGKRALLDKMPGDEWQKRANYRLLLAYMAAHPGKKLLFMGSEFGQWHEWRDGAELDWGLLADARHRALSDFNRDLNRLYAESPQLHGSDCDPDGFAWIDLHNAAQSVFAFERRATAGDAGAPLVCVFNATPVPRDGYWIGVDAPGRYLKLLDSDAPRYGGSGYNRATEFEAGAGGAHGRPHALRLALPPLGALILRRG
ncbi:MAG TPA: 1,4-alpha-glucan branching protein GlgB [Steroidobacteraceae bacterium]|nr:1,4-alpha-glucan branching protein GlgB [Steroidobacteraceae bacterium]